MPIDLIGINCGTGPETMAEHVRTLVQGTALPVSVLPNAGLPETRNGKSVFPLQPETLADWHEKFVTEYGVNVVGGCCGTSPAHMKAVVDRIALRSPLQRHVAHVPALSSLYSQQPYSRDCGCLIVAGKTNANQNDQFRSQLLEGEIDGLVAIARKQAREGAHVVDLCVDCPGRDPVEDIRLVASRFAESLKAAVMVDSGTKSELVFEEALKRLPGKSIVSSVSFEDGGKTVAKVLPICRKYGAAVVCRTIDENGSAHDIDGVLRVARRLYRVAVDDYQIAPENLFFDTLTLDAIRAIKAEMPCANTIMNVADLSSAVDTDARAVFESVLAHHAQLAGATAVIVTNAKLVPISSLPQDKVQAAEALIFDRES
jgi:5-methyltetrahydrofolate--homocysteine methyltransferase